MIKTVVKVRGSTNDIISKYNINSFYYSTGNHTQRMPQSDDKFFNMIILVILFK
jgi:hypothetical protein